MNLVAFPSADLASDFTAKFPSRHTRAIIRTLENSAAVMRNTLHSQTERGAFDLGVLPIEERHLVAQRYTDIHNKILETDRQARDLELARKLISLWEENL